jgi:hypothetical protein
MKLTEKVKYIFGGICAALTAIVCTAIFVYPVAISQLVGLAVQANATATSWNNVKDAGIQTDGVNSGVLSAGLFSYNGNTWDRWKGQTAVAQRGIITNSLTTGSANTTNTVTLTGAANTNIHIYKVWATCSPDGGATFIIQDNGVTIWNAVAGTAPIRTEETFPVGLTISSGSNAVVQLSACGTGNTGSVFVQSDRY